MGVPLNKYGFVTSLRLSMVFNDVSGFSIFLEIVNV